eukprot:CAMPEP_0197905588 /NCGR_PEP_ID=MMETSP1439-20131203/60714_1 /TAXON_ID=66791 /ORGANISM="Gonyaulax spinifera, Strain CCMP409" /LENGTH=49 /DNA_ID= /DNA_START= /DNA_END= /DNA_ORIENTATION=
MWPGGSLLLRCLKNRRSGTKTNAADAAVASELAAAARGVLNAADWNRAR